MKVALIGLGGMGQNHAGSIAASDLVELVAVCDVREESAREVGGRFGVPGFTEMGAMLASEEADAVLIATPHPHHLEATSLAFASGKHVLVEKPLAIRLSDAQAMVEAHRAAEEQHGHLLFGAVFQQRTYGYWKKIKELIDSGGIGRLIRLTWIITDWYRTQAYYDSGGWRATWRTEGGGVLMNQAAHNIDIYQWFAGRPSRISAVAGFGKYHRIEVEDEITVTLEHPTGMVGHVISSTAESPGTNRLEIVGEDGSLVFERDKLSHTRTSASVLEFIHDSPERFVHVPHTEEILHYDHHGEAGHRFVIEDFAEAWREGREPLAPAEEGLVSLEIANGAIMSAVEGRRVELPLDAGAYDALLDRLVSEVTR